MAYIMRYKWRNFTNEIGEIVNNVSKVIPGKNLGIHAHNDTENAVANSLTAVLAGARQYKEQSMVWEKDVVMQI